jgi:hypothetical protein
MNRPFYKALYEEEREINRELRVKIEYLEQELSKGFFLRIWEKIRGSIFDA